MSKILEKVEISEILLEPLPDLLLEAAKTPDGRQFVDWMLSVEGRDFDRLASAKKVAPIQSRLINVIRQSEARLSGWLGARVGDSLDAITEAWYFGCLPPR